MSSTKRIWVSFLTAAVMSGAASGQASRWTRSAGGAVIDVMELKPTGEGYLVELREGEGRPVYSAGFCVAPGAKVVCAVKAARTGRSGIVVLEPRGAALGYGSWDAEGAQPWRGDFQLASGSLRGGTAGGAGIGLGAASKWTRTESGKVVDIMDLAPRGEGAAVELREEAAAPAYSRGFCVASGDATVCSVVGTKTQQTGLVMMRPAGAGMSYRSWSLAGEVRWTGACERAGGAAAGAGAFAGTTYQVENYVYNTPDAFGGRRNLHDFVVDWAGCRVRNVSAEADAGQVAVKVLTCRPQTRLTFTTTNAMTGAVVDYDWLLKDGGKTVFGAWRQGSGFGVTAGAVR